MCSIWKKQNKFTELSLDLVDEIFKDPFLNKNIEIINLTGGEPTLHPEFEKIVEIIVRNCPRLKRIDVPTNGIDTDKVVDRIERALAVIFPYSDVRLTVTVSLDGVGETHEKIRGVSGCFEKVVNTVKELKKLESLYHNFSLSLNTVINKINYDKLEQIRFFARENNIFLNYTLGAISEVGVESIQVKEGFYLDDEEKKRTVATFIKWVKENKEITPSYANFLINFLNTSKRKWGCVFKERKAVLLDADGKIYACGNYKKFYIGDITKNSFKEIWRSFKIPRNYWRICEKCESNCYWDER